MAGVSVGSVSAEDSGHCVVAHLCVQLLNLRVGEKVGVRALWGPTFIKRALMGITPSRKAESGALCYI